MLKDQGYDFNKHKTLKVTISMDHNQLIWGKSDHLEYLEKNPDVFKDDDAKAPLLKDLACTNCGQIITSVSQRLEIWGSHDYTFGNLGYPVRIGCFKHAPGCTGIERISHGYSWFRGYAWQIQLCSNCYAQMGWKYMSGDDSFFGLIFGMLQEK